jgi:antitoxin MazE
MISMEVHTSKLDNDLTLQIPLALASEIGLEPNSSVDISILGNSIIINPSRRPRRKLDDLLAGVTEDNLHGETDTGPAVGREVW